MEREQKRALFGIIIFGSILLTIIVLFIINNPAEITQNRPLEITYIVLFVGGVLSYGLMNIITSRRSSDEKFTFDERDALVAKGALHTQLAAVLITATIWCVVLSLIYTGEDGIPSSFMLIIINSLFFVNMLFRSVSVFRGYKMSTEDLEKRCSGGRLF